MDKSDELRLLPLSVSWYHADVAKVVHPLFDSSAPEDAVCANLSALQLRKYATPSDTASGIAVVMLRNAEKSADAKAALASVTQSVQQMQGVLSQFVSDDACMLSFVTQFVTGVAGEPAFSALCRCQVSSDSLISSRRDAQSAARPRGDSTIHVSTRCPF
jgi:hypothetical protein